MLRFHERRARAVRAPPSTPRRTTASVGGAVSRGDACNAAHQRAKRLVEIHSADPPGMVGALPAHPPRADPAWLRLIEFKRAGDQRLLGFRLYARARGRLGDDAPGGKLGLGRNAQ